LRNRAVCLSLFSVFSVSAQNFTTGQAARAVIGQQVFTGGTATASQVILGGASGIAYANGTLFVADDNVISAVPHDQRVLLFNTGLIPSASTDLTSLSSYSPGNCNLCGFPAYLSLGQSSWTPPDTTTDQGTAIFDSALTNTGMRNPTAVASDGTHLAVADTNNNRVLLWLSMPSSMDQPADVVLGQTNFTTGTTPTTPTASSLSGPQGVWIQNGKLFVADTQDYRILIWNSIPTSNGQPADVVLGQPNFNSPTNPQLNNPCPPTKSTVTAKPNQVCDPISVTSDGSRLFVADYGFNRVLIWNSVPGTNNQAPDLAVGQPDLVSGTYNNPAACSLHSLPQTNTTLSTSTTGTTTTTGTNTATTPTTINGPCQNSLSFPRFALSDGTRLFIADGGNDRVLIYNSIPTANGAVADEVLGQPDFVTDTSTSQTISIASTAVDNTSGVDVTPSPTSLAFDGSNLYVADPTNNRVLVFTPGNTPLPNNSVLNWASEIIRQEAVITITANTVNSGDTVTVTITPPSGTKATYTYTVAKSDTASSIAQGVVNAINNSNSGAGDPSVTAIVSGANSTSSNTAYVYLSSKATDLPYDSIAFTATASNTTNLTIVNSGNGYLSAGTGATASPGMLVEIDGSNLSDIPAGSPLAAPLSGTLPTALGGVQVYMDGVATPILSASANQIITEVPYDFGNRNSTSVYVRTSHTGGNVTVTNATPVYIAPANPGIFSAPTSPGQPRPWQVTGAFHQPGNATFVISVDGTATAGNIATITVNGRAYSYTAASGDTLNSIQNGLITAINNANDPQVTASPGAAFTRVVLTARQSGAAGVGIPVSTSTSSGSSVTLSSYTGSSTCCDVTPGSPISPSNPAGPGELITVSAAGLGTLSGATAAAAQVTGSPYNGPVPNSASNSVYATMGGSTAQVIVAGLPTGSYGVYQVQMVVPSGLSANNQTQLYLAQNAFISNIATIAVGTPHETGASSSTTSAGNSTPTVGPVRISIDVPAANGPALSGAAAIGGWAYDQNAAISSVTLTVDGTSVGTATYGGDRSDVCAAVGQVPGCPNLGWNFVLNTARYADGTHTLDATATGADGLRATISRTFTTSNYAGLTSAALPMKLDIDQPDQNTGSVQGTATFSGWALDSNAAISNLTLSIDGRSMGAVSFGSPRPDVCVIYAAPGCPDVGWSTQVDTTTLSNGTHTLTLAGSAANGDYAAVNQTFTVGNYGPTVSNPLHVSIDTPGPQSGAFSGSVAFGGWALADNEPIVAVTVNIDGIAYGNALYGGNRTDVCGMFPNRPGCPNVGWNFGLDTTQLADGKHTLAITAVPVVGQSFTQTQTFTVDNTGTAGGSTVVVIDRPSFADGPFSGTAAFGGWAANPSSPISTVQVYIDGQAKGMAQYGGSRPDVCSSGTLTNAPGCPNVGWNLPFDTTQIANGRHVLEVTATSASGQRVTNSVPVTIYNAVSSPTTVVITVPNSQSIPFLGIATFNGSAANTNGTQIGSVSVTVDGVPYGTAALTRSGGVNTGSSWSFMIDTTRLADGTHTLGVTATATDGTQNSAFAAFGVSNWVSAQSENPVQISIDSPSGQSGPFSGTAHFGGWAVDAYGVVTSVNLAVDGVPVGTASYGGARADVCAALSSVSCPNVGWNALVDTTGIANGPHTLDVTVTNAYGQSSTASANFVVLN
jgi:uncharacterized protein (TIGR03437 family)